MYSILVLGVVMMGDGFGARIPAAVSLVATFLIVGFFLLRSLREVVPTRRRKPAAGPPSHRKP